MPAIPFNRNTPLPAGSSSHLSISPASPGEGCLQIYLIIQQQRNADIWDGKMPTGLFEERQCIAKWFQRCYEAWEGRLQTWRPADLSDSSDYPSTHNFNLSMLSREYYIHNDASSYHRPFKRTISDFPCLFSSYPIRFPIIWLPVQYRSMTPIRLRSTLRCTSSTEFDTPEAHQHGR
jgi:hypothetical protein